MSSKNGHTEPGCGAQFIEEDVAGHKRATGVRCKLTGRADVAQTVETVVAGGGYISFGETGDGGALLIRVLDNGKKLTSYCHTDSELAEALLALRTRFAKVGSD